MQLKVTVCPNCGTDDWDWIYKGGKFQCKKCGYRYTEKIEVVLEDWRKICGD